MDEPSAAHEDDRRTRVAGLSRPRQLALALAVALLVAAGIGAVGARTGDTPVQTADAAPAPDGAPTVALDTPVTDPSPGQPGADALREPDEARAEMPEPEPGPEPEPVVWAAPDAPSPVEPVPADQRVPKPEAVRGIYVGSWPVGSATAFDRLIGLARETEINAFVIDVKDVKGEVSYPSQVPLAGQVGATDNVRIADMRAVLDRLREEGIYPIARIVAFKDPMLATARPEWAIEREDGSVWEDNNGVHWVDSYNRNVWDYNIQLAREAIALGFSEIQWDYIRFPDAPRSYIAEAVYPAREGRTRVEAIREFMTYSQERLADLDVPVTADVFGITTSAYNDVGIGQLWEQMADVMDVLLPMVYPSHYPDGSWGYENPNGAPYQIVRKALGHGVSRSEEIENAAGIRPWLQAFSLGEPAYGPRHVRAQIDAVYDAGLTEWILWHPGVRYDPEALASADGIEPWFAGLGAELYEPPPAPTPDSAAAEASDRDGHGR